MPRRKVGTLLGVVAALAVALGSLAPARAQTGAPCASCTTGATGGHFCQKFHCPPPLHHCQERPPRLCIECGCPRPICNPCHLPNFGYFQTCWTPWPEAGNWTHCSVPPPAAFVQLGPPAALPGGFAAEGTDTTTGPGALGISPSAPSAATPLPSIPRPLPAPTTPGVQPRNPLEVDPVPLPAPRPMEKGKSGL